MADIEAPKVLSLPGVQTAKPVETENNTDSKINVLSLPGVASKTPEMDAKVKEAQAFIQNTMNSENPEDTAVKTGLAWYLSDTFKIPFSEALQHQDLYLSEYDKLGKGKKTIWEQTSDHFSASLQNMVIGRQIYRSIHTKDPEKKKVLQADIEKRKSELPSTEADVTTGLASYLSAGADFAGSMVIPALVTTLVSAVAQPALPVALSAFGVAAPKIAKIGSMLVRVGAGWRETAIAETGLLYDRMTENGVPEEVAKKYAEEYGWLAGGIEMIELETAFTTLPFLGQAGKTAFGLLMARNFMTQEGLKTIGQIAARTGTNLLINTATNTFQETWQQVEEEKFYKKANLDDLKDFEPEIRERMGKQYDEWYTDYIHTLKERNEYFGSEQYAEDYAKAVWDTFVNAAKGSLALFGAGSGVQALVDVSKMTLSNSEKLKRKVEQEKRRDTLNKEKDELKDKPETEYNKKRNEAVDEELADIDRQEKEDTENSLRENVKDAEEKFYANPTDETKKGLDEARQALDEYEKGTNISDTERTYNEQLENEEFTEEDADSLIESDQKLQREQKRRYNPKNDIMQNDQDWQKSPEEIETPVSEPMAEGDVDRFAQIIREKTPGKVSDIESEVIASGMLDPLAKSLGMTREAALNTVFMPEVAMNVEEGKTYNIDGENVYIEPAEKGYVRKGAVYFSPKDGKAIILLTKNADASTWVHEVGHIIRRHIAGDMKTELEGYYNVKDGIWTKGAEEQFTEDLTTFMMTGKAPTTGLKKIFRIIADALWNVYRTLDKRDMLSEEKKQFFNRLFSENQNYDAQAEYNADSMLYSTAEEADAQYKEIESKYKGTDQWMKAPNGKPTNLTERQWVQVRTPAFKAWFGDWENDPQNASKVVDENGEPKVVYHGSRTFGVEYGEYVPYNDMHFGTKESAIQRGVGKQQEEDYDSIEVFEEDDGTYSASINGETLVEGEASEQDAHYKAQQIVNQSDYSEYAFTDEEIGAYFLNIRDAKRTPDMMKDWSEAISDAKAEGHDGLIYRNKVEDVGNDTYVAFSPEQIKSATDNVGTFDESNPSILFQTVTDEELLEKLNSEPTVKVYRAMQEIDGKLYPPMAARVKGKFVQDAKIGEWIQADENPNITFPKKLKNGEIRWMYKLNKGNGKTLDAAYNPYWHTSRSPLNDQFSSAYTRPNLVTVEVEVPQSELTSGYKADKAKDAVGEMKWHTGVVSSKLAKAGKPRRVILSRYCKVVRVVPDSEVATKIADMLKGTDIAIPDNTVTPMLAEELKKQGVKVEETEEVRDYNSHTTLYQTDTEYLDAVNSGDMAKAQAMVDARAREMGYNSPKLYHWTSKDFDVFDTSKSGENQGQRLGDGIYMATNPREFSYAGNKRLSLYANIQNPFKMELTEEQAEQVYDKYFAPHHDDKFGAYKPHVVNSLQYATKVFDYLKQAAKENDIRTSAILQDLGYDGIKDGMEWVAFSPNQIKSADPVTYDDAGNVIPLSQRFNEQNNSLLYQENEEIYRDATENGEYVPDDIIDQYRGQEWAENEIQARDYYRMSANDYDTFEQFLASMENLDTEKSDDYYQQIWDSRLDIYSDYEQMLPQITKRMMEKMLRLLKKLVKRGKATSPEGLLGEYVKNFKKGLTDKEYSELMSEIKSAPDKYISFLSSCFSDQTEFEQMMRTLASHPDYEVRTLKALVTELKKKNKVTLADYDRKIKELERQYKEAMRNGEKAERRAERLQELRKAQNERAYYQRLVRIIFRKPPKMCLNEIANKILAIQAMYSPSTLLDKTRAKLQMEMMNSTDKTLQKALKQRLDRKSLREMSLDEVAEIAAEITELRREGVEARMAQLMDIREANLSWIDRLLTAIGETEPLDRTGSIESKDNKGNLYNRFVAYWADIHRMTDMMGKAWGEWLGNIKKSHEDEMRNVDRRRTAFNKKMAELKIDDKLLAKVEEIKGDQFIADEKGNKYTHDILMCWYAYTQNEDSMAALIFGNFKGNPEVEERMKRIYATIDEGISRLTNAEKELVDWAIESFSGEDWQRLADAIRIVENRSPEKISRYFPMMRVLDSTADVQSEPLVDLGDRSAGAKRTSVKKGFTQERIHNIDWSHQKPLQLGFMSNYLKAIQNQEHYIAFAQLSKDMKYVYGHVEEAVTSKYGKAWNDSMRAWIDRTINPNVYNNFYNQQTMLDKLISNTVVGSLAYNALSWLKQFPSVMFFLPYCSGGSLMNSFYHYVTDFKKMTEFAKERSPYLKMRSIDDIITLVNKRLKDPNSKTKALDKFVEWGMKPYSWFDEFACVIGWNAVYTTEMEKGATEEQAIEKANEALLKTQPQADALFSPVAYSNPKLRPFLLFTRQANQITQMVIADFRNKGLSDEQVAEKVKFFYRLVFCVAFNALLMGWAGRKFAGYGDDDKDKSVAEDILREIGANMAYNFPLVGGTIANTIQRKGYTAGGFVDPLSDLVGTAGNFTNKPIKNGEFNYDQLMRMITSAMGTAGLPKVATQRAYNAIKENDLWYIIMGSPLGGKNGNK